jgi:alpha-L-rhamnosidase
LSYSYSWKIFPFFRKWMEDMRVDQLANGILPAVSPTYWYFYPYGHIWPSGITLIPEILRTQYGDRRVIDENYDAAHKWMRFLESRRLDQAGIFHKGDWGDWQEVSVNIGKGKTTPIALIETAYFFHHCGLMEKTALKLGRLEDAAHYRKLGEKTKLAFNQNFFNPVSGVYAKGAQTTYALVLMFDLVPSASRQKVIENFIDSILEKAGGHPSSGMVGMQWIFQALDKIGRNDVALEMLQKEAFPSWGYMISKGATSIWEKWNSDTAGPGMNSQGLLFLGGNINAWLFECLAGLRPDPADPGFKHIIFKPHLLGDLTFAQAKYQSPYGEVLSDWNLAGGSLDWSIVVPPNSRGTVYLPASNVETVRINRELTASADKVRFLRTEGDRLVYSVGAGKYRFIVESDELARKVEVFR